MEVYEKTIEVQAGDLDDLDHVNNVRFVQWIQDISKEHWESRVSEQMKNKIIWVVMTHNIEYKNAAKLGDIVHLKTHIASTKGATSIRIVEMRNKKTDELLVRSKTNWCLLNPRTFRPMRISEEISAVFNTKSP